MDILIIICLVILTFSITIIKVYSYKRALESKNLFWLVIGYMFFKNDLKRK